MGDSLNIRFRHTQGDIGPLKLPSSTTVQAVKERLLSQWPKGELELAIQQEDCLVAGSSSSVKKGRCKPRVSALPKRPKRQSANGRLRTAEGPLSSEAPGSSADIKLILSGKFLENSETIEGDGACTFCAPSLLTALPSFLTLSLALQI